MEEAEEDSTVAGAADFMEAAEAGFMVAEVLVEEAEAARSAAGTRMAGTVADMAAEAFAAAVTVGAAIMAVAAATAGAAGVTDGAAEVGVMAATVTEEAGAGDLDLGGRIGDMAGDIRMATTATIPGITRPTLTRIRPTVTRRTI